MALYLIQSKWQEFFFHTSDSFKLTDLSIQEGLQHDRPHQADSDAYVTAELLLILLEQLHKFR